MAESLNRQHILKMIGLTTYRRRVKRRGFRYTL